jgi:hypothetical protein
MAEKAAKAERRESVSVSINGEMAKIIAENRKTVKA